MAVAQIFEQPVLQDMEPSRYRWTTNALYRAIDAYVFDHPQRIELIEGELIEKVSHIPRHASLISKLNRLLLSVLGARFSIRVQSPLHLSNISEPEPDILVAVGEDGDYDEHHPTPDQAALVIEVADRSESYYTREKALLYGKSGIADYWVFLLRTQELIVHRQTSQTGYIIVTSLKGNEEVALLVAPEFAFTLNGIFGKDA